MYIIKIVFVITLIIFLSKINIIKHRKVPHSLSNKRALDMERDIKNKIIAVTGGADGIGFQIARNFLQSEAKLAILLDINEINGNIAFKKLTTEFGPDKVVFIKCNVIEDLEQTYQKIYKEFGIIDVLINSAGLVDEVVAERCIDVNLTASVKWSLKFMELMRKDVKGNGGTIVNIASIFGYRVADYAPVYTATKYGVIGFTKALGHEKRYRKKQVRVIAICPGFTKTNITQNIQDVDTDLHKEIRNNYQWQTAEVVGERAVEIFKIADSGTLWEIEGGVMNQVK